MKRDRTTAELITGCVAFLCYFWSIVLANWLIRHVGAPVLPDGTHLMPVGFGLVAPSGTIAATTTLAARDVTQRFLGRRYMLLTIFLGGILSVALSTPLLALASSIAFLFGEYVDYFVYTPLQRRGLVRAVFASMLVGACVDSVLFLTIARIPLGVALPGLLLGRLWVALALIPLIALLRRWFPTPAAQS